MRRSLLHFIRVALVVSFVVVLTLLKKEHILSGSGFLRHRSLQLSQRYQQQQPQPSQQQNALFQSGKLPSTATWRSESGLFSSQVQNHHHHQQQQQQQQMYTPQQATQQTGGTQQVPDINGHQNSSVQQQAYSTHSNGSQQPASWEQRLQQPQRQQINQQQQQVQPQQAAPMASNLQYSSAGNSGFNQQEQQQVQQTQVQQQRVQQTQQPLVTYPPQEQQSQLQLQSQVQAPQMELPQKLEQQAEDAPKGVSVPEQDPDCVVPDAAEKSIRDPVWTASYPGSGAKLTWKLIRAITGIFTSDDHDHNGRVGKGTVVAIKTHYPSHTPPEIFHKDKLKHIGRAVLLTRNPIKSIPSYHNFVYEQQNGLLNHSTRAPLAAWIKWRNSFFELELQTWVDHQKYWLDKYPGEPDKLHLVAMEHLTSNTQGANTLHLLGGFLAKGGQEIAESLVPGERMSCIWDMFVHGKVPGERERRHSHRSGGPESYPFTQLQLDHMISALSKLKNEYPSFQELSIIVDEYIADIEEDKGRIQQL